MIFIASDHGGYQLKKHIINYLQKEEKEYQDLGTDNEKSVDYPDFALKLGNLVSVTQPATGILICGTGIGMSIAANKVKGIRAALCHNEFTAQMSREHNNANILCLGGRILDFALAQKITQIFLTTDFAGNRHLRRINKINSIEQKC